MQSFRLGRIAGIDVRIHPTFFILPLGLGAWYASTEGSAAVGVRVFVAVLLIFTCVLGHELTHSLAAQALGIAVPRITFYPIGGVASLHHIPRRPSEEALIAAVGPLFNFALAAALYFPMLRWIGREALYAPDLGTWTGVWANVFWANPVLGAFNLLPAFPMDGGRLLRAFLAWTTGSRERATRISAFLGKIFAIVFILLGLRWHTWTLVLVGIYVFGAASREGRIRPWGGQNGDGSAA